MTIRLQLISNPADITVNGQLGTGGINRGRKIINSPQIEPSATEKIEANTNGLGRLLRYRLGTLESSAWVPDTIIVMLP